HLSSQEPDRCVGRRADQSQTRPDCVKSDTKLHKYTIEDSPSAGNECTRDEQLSPASAGLFYLVRDGRPKPCLAFGRHNRVEAADGRQGRRVPLQTAGASALTLSRISSLRAL